MQKKRNVLVVEDILMVRKAICTILECDGFEVFGCEDGSSALDATAGKYFDIIIIDYRMPNMNGVDATRHLRMRFPSSVIIGSSTEDKRDDFLLAGADAFLSKPYRYHDLTDLINSVSKTLQ